MTDEEFCNIFILFTAFNLGHEIFAVLPPEKEDALKRFWISELEKWQTELKTYQKLAETGKYVGKETISSILQGTKKQIDVPDTFEFLKQIVDNKPDWQDLKEDFEELHNFYTTQLLTWEKMINALAGSFSSNRLHLEKDETVKKALHRLDEISKMPRPFGVLHETTSLLSTVNSFNENLIDETKKNAVAEMELSIEKLKQQLDEVNADADFRNKTLYPIVQIKTRTEKSESLPNIYFDKTSEFPGVIEKAEELIERKRHAEMPDNMPLPKPIFNVKPSQLAGKTFIESEIEAEEFLAKLHENIRKGLAEEKRVKIP